MSLTLIKKKEIIKNITKQASLSLSIGVADYSGLTANQLNILHKEARDLDVYLRVINNNLFKIALKNTKFECLIEKLNGSLIIAFSKKEINASAKLFFNFMKENNLKIKNIVINNKLFGYEKIEEISNLPNKKGSIELFIRVSQLSIKTLVLTINNIIEKIIRLFYLISNSK